MCVPNYFDVTNEILELQSDLHANDFALCEAHTLWNSNVFVCFSLLVRESRPSLNDKGLFPPSFDTATFGIGILAVGCVLVCRTACWFHWNLQLLPWRSEL